GSSLAAAADAVKHRVIRARESSLKTRIGSPERVQRLGLLTLRSRGSGVSFGEGNPPPPPLSDVLRLRADQPAVGELLQAVRGPAGHAADGKSGGEQGGRQVEAVQQERGVELDVGVEAAVGLALAQQPQGGGFDAARQVVETAVAAVQIEALG